MFYNLKEELNKIGKNYKDLVPILGIAYNNICYRLRFGSIKVTEANKIKNELFPDLTIDYLFDTKKEN